MEPPETRYAQSGDLHIAYQVVGRGEPLVVSDQWFGNVDDQWEFPPMARFLGRLASFRRLVLFEAGDRPVRPRIAVGRADARGMDGRPSCGAR